MRRIQHDHDDSDLEPRRSGMKLSTVLAILLSVGGVGAVIAAIVGIVCFIGVYWLLGNQPMAQETHPNAAPAEEVTHAD